MKLKKLFLNLLEKFKNKKEKLNLPTRRLVFVIFILLTITFFISRSSLASLSFFSTDSLNKGLVGHWPLDGEHFNSNANRVDDISGYQNHGTNNGASLSNGVMGEIEGAFDVNYNEQVYFPDNQNIDFNFNDNFSMSVWLKATEAPGRSDEFPASLPIFVKGEYGDSYGIQSYGENLDNISFQVRGDSSGIVSYSINLLNNWVHAVGTYNGSSKELKLYVNGEFIGSDVYTGNDFGSSDNYELNGPVVGGNGPNSAGRFKASDTRVYNRALSESEVKRLYEKYQPKLSTGGLNKKLVGHWSLKPSSGSTARSCKAILDNNKSHGDGIYKIDPDGPGGNDSFEVYCDMTTDGGGWTLVTNIVDTNANNIPDTISDVRSGWTEVSEGNLASFDGANTYDLSYFVGNSNLESFDPSNIKICATKTKLDKRCYSDIIEADDFTYNGYGGGTGITSSNNFLKIAAALSGTVAYGDNISGEHGEFIDEDVDPEFTLFYGDGYTSSSGGHFRQWSGDNANWHVWGFGIAQTNDYTDDREIYNNGSSDSGQLRPYTAGWEVWLRESDANTLADTKDNSPNSNHGEIHGAQIRNHGASFDGVDSYISLSGDSLDQTSNKGSLSLWVRSNSPSSTESIFHTEENRDRAIWTDSGVFYAAQYYDSTGSFEVVSGGNVDTNWHHIVFFWDLLNGNEKLYVDGVLVDSISPLAGTDVSRGSPTLLGGARGADANVPSRDNLNGNISDVKIYDRALSDSEVSDLYNGKDISGAILDMPLNQKTNFKDISGNNYHGTNNGASIIGEAAYFDGTDDYIDLNSSISKTQLDMGSLSVWFKTNDGTTQALFNRRYNNSNRVSIGLGDGTGSYNNDSLNFVFIDENKQNLIMFVRNGESYYADNRWHNLVITGGGNNNIYIDGEKESVTFMSGGITTPVFLSLSNQSTSMSLGRRFYPSLPDYFNGEIKDFYIYNRALSEAEIKSIYNKGRSGSNASVGLSTGSLSKGLVLDMPLSLEYTKNETVGSEIMADTTPYSNDGQNYGATVGSDYTSFDGTNDYVTGSDSSFSSDSNPRTISLWAKASTDATSGNVVFAYGTTNAGESFGLTLVPGINRIQVFGWGGSVYDLTSTSETINVDEWYHIVGINNGTTSFLYLNGDFITSSNKSLSTVLDKYTIGRDNNGNQPFEGQVSNVKIYNRVLSKQEIKTLFDKERGQFGI